MNENRSFVLVVKLFQWHAHILDPIADRLTKYHKVVSTSRHALINKDCILERAPDLVVVADASVSMTLRSLFPDSIFLHVGHGLISKNQPERLYHFADYVCVASQNIANRLTSIGHAPRRGFLATGLVQGDPLFHDLPRSQGTRVPGCGITIAYAPTWNPTLSSAMMLADSLVDLVRGQDTNIGIVIKPHPHIAVKSPSWIDMWRAMAEKYQNVVLHPPEENLIPVLIGADLLLSDASSAIFHFLALNRPIVLIDNPERFTTPDCFDPDGIEWQWRDIAICVDNVSDLGEAVANAVSNPEQNESARLARRTALFGNLTDGKAVDRVITAANRIIEERCQA